MSRNKKLASLFAIASIFVLTGCSTDEMKYPKNYADALFSKDGLGDNVDLAQNEWRQYYDSLTNNNEIYEKTVKDILLKIAAVAHDYKGDKQSSVWTVANDSCIKYSVADNSQAISATFDNLFYRAADSLASSAKNGTYEKDNLFMEEEYAKYLKETYYYFDYQEGDVNTEGKLLTPEAEFEDIYKKADTYKTYMEKELYDDMKINYLTSEYIINESYASIGNTNARKVQVVALTDRSDEPGDAKQLLDAYVEDYIRGTKKDENFYTLQRLWKGITSDVAGAIDSTRYGQEIVLTAEEEQWMRDHNIIEGTFGNEDYESHTLYGKVHDDMKKIADGQTYLDKLDSSLESSYTGNYTYDTKTGYKKAVDDIATKNQITSGLYLKSAGISALPSALTERIFSAKATSDKTTLTTMKENVGTKGDLTVYQNDGYRYLTVADTLTGEDTDNIVYYDASSKTYYITRILDVVDTNAMTIGSTTSIYSEEAKAELAREVAYVMSTTGSYKSKSGAYWLSRVDFSYSDEAFLEYMKANYQDVFKTENPYSDTAKYPKFGKEVFEA